MLTAPLTWLGASMTQTETTSTPAAPEATVARAGATAPDAPLGALEIHRRAVGPSDVRMRIGEFDGDRGVIERLPEPRA